MSVIKELQRLIRTGAPVSGRVVSVSSTSVVVATGSGQVEVLGIGDFTPGDLVVVEAGRATKRQRGGGVPVYFV
jgi:hypothetical protein